MRGELGEECLTTRDAGTGSPGTPAASVPWMSGASSSPKRLTGQTITAALPMTSSTATVPEFSSPMCALESADADRWSPMTHSRPSGTVTGPNARLSGGVFSKTYGSSSGSPSTVTRPSVSQHWTVWPPVAMTRLT